MKDYDFLYNIFIGNSLSVCGKWWWKFPCGDPSDFFSKEDAIENGSQRMCF